MHQFKQSDAASRPNFTLIVCTVLAVSIHIVLFSLINILIDLLPKPQQKTISEVTLIPSQAQTASQANSNLASASSENNREFLSSTSNSSFKTPIAQDARSTNAPSKYEPSDQASMSDSYSTNTNIPTITLPTNSLQQRNSAPQQNIRSLFQQQPTNTTQKEQISTKSLPELSQYELSLLNRLSSDSLYDDFHAVMRYSTQEQVEYILSLRLFKSGAIRSAKIVKSSGIEAIDRLAEQTAYRASPYPPPPAADAPGELRYEIPIIYDRRGKN